MILRLCYSPCYRDIASLRSIDDKTKDLSNFDYRPIALNFIFQSWIFVGRRTKPVGCESDRYTIYVLKFDHRSKSI